MKRLPAPEIKNGIYVWDITISAKDPYNTPGDVINIFNKKFKKWCFQKELGSNNNYKHWQCRISTFKKNRCKPGIEGVHPDAISPTSNENKNNDFYIMKEETRIEGPWTDKDTPVSEQYIPKQYRIDTLYPFQQSLLDIMKIFDKRSIYYIYNESGNIGKTTFSGYAELQHKATVLPVTNDSDKLIQSCCNILMGKQQRTDVTIIIDLPRALQNKDKLYGLFVAIEVIKSGKVYDMRNRYKQWFFDSPTIIVFSNCDPEEFVFGGDILSQDRWQLKTIVDNELIDYQATSK